MSNSDDTALLVLSCDKYSDVWNPFFSFFFKYFPTCPYPVYLGTNYLKFEHPSVITLNSGIITDWSTETKRIIEQIPYNYIILLLEDYFLYKPVDASLLNDCIDISKRHNALFMLLAAFPNKYVKEWWNYKLLEEDQRFGIIENGQKYKISLQTGLWNKKKWLEIIKEGESPWEFETKGSSRSQSYTTLSVKGNPALNYVHGPFIYLCSAITQGIWMRETIKLSKKENIYIDTSKRPVESCFSYYQRKIYIASPFFVRKIFDFIKKLFHKFFNYKCES